ncbi:MAG TPA: protease modulator HflC [Spirochaetia bacterium]|nr:protease modulator HflC [Spirochaetia bacterium]
MKKLVTILVIIGIALIVLLIMGPFFILQEGEQAVVVRFGEIVVVYGQAGLKFKTPFVENVVKYPKKILSWDGASQIIPTKQPENQFIWVDTTARWKIIDLKLFYESVGTVTQAMSRLDDIIDSNVRAIVSQNFLLEAIRNSNEIYDSILQQLKEANPLSDEKNIQSVAEGYKIIKGREILSKEMLDRSRAAIGTVETSGAVTNQYGIELIDIVVRQIKYSDDLTESVYQRMIQERNQQAEKTRSVGKGEKANILGKLEQDRQTILSQAYSESETIKGTADAEATQIYARAYGRNREFFSLWRSLESYKQLLPNFKKTLSTDADYFNYLYNTQGR